jgi:leucyl-tRNA synthetase
MYTGGAEHSVLHLLYSRFVTMVLHDWGYLDFDEPFREFYAHGLVIKDGAKMSKSKGNVVTPDEYIEMYGSDALRMYLMFMGPFSAGGDFRDTAMEGMSRWTGRVWRLALASVNAGAGKSPNADQQSKLPGARISTALHHLIKKVGDDLEKRRYNTAIASMMEFTNLVADNGNYLPPGDLAKFILILAPFAPYMTEELWQLTHGRKGEYSAADSVHLQSWPSYEAAALVSRTVKIIVQVNGKIRDLVPMSVDDAADRGKIEAVARASDKVRIYLSGRDIRKVVVVVGKLVNFVV